MNKTLFASICLLTVSTCLNAQKVLTVGLGDQFYYGGAKFSEIQDFYHSMKGRGISIVWAANPGTWEKSILERPAVLKYYQDVAAIVRANGMGVGMGLHPQSLFPNSGGENWTAYELDPKTGLRKPIKMKWDIASETAFAELSKRYEKIMQALKPRELYFVDETILINPGKDAHMKKMSAYWTSPTYSEAALEAFRKYLKKRRFPKALSAKFPITTKEVAPNAKANMGLPAIPVNEKNSAYLVADNNWPDSRLWQLWYDWREDILTHLYEVQIKLAQKTFSDNPNWQGVMVSSPTFWFCRETGLNADKVARIPELKYLVAGYMNGYNILKLKPSARRCGKKLGGMIELTVYGSEKSRDPKETFENFKYQIKNGAELMLFYPLANLNKQLISEKLKKIGMDYRPSCVKLWKTCATYLKQNHMQVKLYFTVKNESDK